MRILSISSQVAYGPVGNSAAVPPMQAMGHEVLAIPTIILSNHPGHGKPAALRMPASDLAAMLGALEGLGVLAACAAVMTGYFAANDQIHGVARMIRRMKEKNPRLYVLVDPVIGDADALYVALPVAEAIRDELLPLADCAAPNRFELEWLTGRPVSSISEARAAAARLPVKEVLATSIAAGADRVATLVIAGGACFEQVTELKTSVPHGTGDFLAGLYLAHRLAADPQTALRHAMNSLENAVKLSAGSSVLNVTAALHGP
jgi:pyridoxine kinase